MTHVLEIFNTFVESLRSGQLILIAVYLAFVLKVGPSYMKNRQPYNLKNIILLYNVFQVVTNLIFVILCAYLISDYKYSDLGCMLTLPADHKAKYIEVCLSNIYYLSRMIDLFDTIFFVLRKNFRQVTFLHIYHHVVIPIIMSLSINSYGTGGHILSYGILNAFVHSIMYAYYFLTTMRPNIKNNLTLKKNITRLQLIQFVLILLHNAYPLLFRPACKYPKFWNILFASQAFVFFVLFSKFYIRTYHKSPAHKQLNKSNGTVKNDSIKTN